LTPQDYGLIGMMAVIVNFVSMFKDLGLATATIQKEEIDDQQISTLFWFNVALSLAVFVVTAAIAPAVSWFYGDSRLTWITAVYGVGFLFGGLAVQHEALLRRQMRFLSLAIVEVASLLIGITVAVVLAWRGFHYWALIFSQLTQGLSYTIGVWIVCRWRPGLPARGSGVRSMLVFGRNLTGFSVVNYFARNLDNLLIGKFWGSQQLGLYAKAYQLLLLPIEQINTPIAAVAVPALSRLNDEPERYRQAYLRILEKVAILTMPGVALMIMTSDWITLIVLGPQWVNAARIFALLGIAGLVQPIANTTGWLFVTQSRTHHMFQWGLIGSTIIILSIVAGLPWGAVGVAASYSITFVVVVLPALLWFVGRTGPVRTRDFYHTMFPYVAATACSLLATFLFRKWVTVTVPLVGVAACLIIVASMTFLVLVVLPDGRNALRDLTRIAWLTMNKVK
jgi:PST family polysaccharide transporter